jgi:Flp pilus assembly pilin Flp
VRATDGNVTGAGAASSRPSGRRALRRGRIRLVRLVRRDADGASTVEYGLLIALICAVLCIGVGFTLQKVFGDAVACFVAGLQGTPPTNCTTAGGGGGGGGTGGGGGGGGGIVPVSPSPSPTATP